MPAADIHENIWLVLSLRY